MNNAFIAISLHKDDKFLQNRKMLSFRFEDIMKYQQLEESTRWHKMCKANTLNIKKGLLPRNRKSVYGIFR
jgi:hypothetical protein